MAQVPEDPYEDVDAARDADPERGSFDPPHHPPLLDHDTNPRGVRHIGETAQDHMPVADRPRVRAAERRRSRMIAAAAQRLRIVTGRRTGPTRSGPDDPAAA